MLLQFDVKKQLIKPEKAVYWGQWRETCFLLPYVLHHSGITVDLWPGHRSQATAEECLLWRKWLLFLRWGRRISNQEICFSLQLGSSFKGTAGKHNINMSASSAKLSIIDALSGVELKQKGRDCVLHLGHLRSVRMMFCVLPESIGLNN